MDVLVLAIFALVYLGMLVGGLPGLALDRTGVALLGAIALLVCERVTPQQAWDAVDVPTIALLLGLMVVSAQFRMAGFYSALTHRLAAARWAPATLLLVLIFVVGLLSAVLANDIVCLAVAPLLVEGCLRRGLRPQPFLLALACAANVGSAATLIGNPQNMLIGQRLGLSFAGYLVDAGVPALLGCGVVWLVIWWLARGHWHQPAVEVHVAAPPLDRVQFIKGAVVTVAVMVAFLAAPWPREIVALGAAGLLLLSRRMHSRAMLGLIDWQLLVLFAGLFIVNHALAVSGWLAYGMDGLRGAGVHVERPAWLFTVSVVLSNLVSNVPAVMLLLPTATHPQAGAILALSSTLAGNLLIVGSIANIIVVDQAGRLGVRISWYEHARVGVPVTLLTLLVAGGWMWARVTVGG